MSSAAAQAYARVASTTSSPRDIEAQALLKAANKLQAVMSDPDASYVQMSEALIYNRKLWTIFLSEAQRDENPQPAHVRQNIANISIFVLSQTAALQISPQREHFKPLIEINRNIAAGLSGRV
ncbi:MULTISPECIES: flagellar biosynthesis regulator FlaF [unclassified Bradyrhizobium]|uniref:flagellar biosynthesis regulator FlaF n=1 Tax=unclassified Bradyrhizobium TaxID=2631580 RepID=UPI001FF71041|nr:MULTISPECIES: flagellar biosynthesis regulator FlaF [unclassified Bradyrhizobium]MCK1710880.1 flagellar biosynthesis regulator FlaF [Bradyrhizobium sp. 143]MCK1728751.1 flagellar biosynthesis regulator FlaF [Bradyrhizobium sp. 142]